MHIHILGICGTFMGGLALLAKQAGHTVSGSDANVYPPMSTQLEEQGIELMAGYQPEHLDPAPDVVIIGNALSRGNEAVEHVLEQGLAYTSGPQWLADHFLQDRWVLAVAGTHGKTTTSSLLAWILEDAGLSPGFLIGGVPDNFSVSARAGDLPFFVIEADEYDTAFFDKRSKFVHYRPRTLILNNLEFDHADIFDDLAAIKKQFHHLLRTVPGNGLIVHNADEQELNSVLEMGCWSQTESFAANSDALWSLQSDGQFKLDDEITSQIALNLPGQHNQLNALAAIAAARHAGVPVKASLDALTRFKGVRRRLQLRGEVKGVQVYDDFAHHPTAIKLTIDALQKQNSHKRVIAVLEPRSNTMRLGVHKAALADSLSSADQVFLYQPADVNWDMEDTVKGLGSSAILENDMTKLVEQVASASQTGDAILIMSNGGFGGIHEKLLERLAC